MMETAWYKGIGAPMHLRPGSVRHGSRFPRLEGDRRHLQADAGRHARDPRDASEIEEIPSYDDVTMWPADIPRHFPRPMVRARCPGAW